MLNTRMFCRKITIQHWNIEWKHWHDACKKEIEQKTWRFLHFHTKIFIYKASSHIAIITFLFDCHSELPWTWYFLSLSYTHFHISTIKIIMIFFFVVTQKMKWNSRADLFFYLNEMWNVKVMGDELKSWEMREKST